jgi:hypothetical protein
VYGIRAQTTINEEKIHETTLASSVKHDLGCSAKKMIFSKKGSSTALPTSENLRQ